MSTGLKVTYLWHDNDVIEIRVTVENARFRGTADTYVGTDGLLEAAAKLEGFPANRGDKREVIFGAEGKGFAGGAAAFISTAQTSLAMPSFEQQLKPTTATRN